MSALKINVDVVGLDSTARDLQRFRNELASRRPLHAAMAKTVGDFTRDYVRTDPTHRTAERLGAAPTGFKAKAAAGIQDTWDDEMAMLLIRRSTGLGRAFGDVTLVPGAGKKYLTIPACAETYGKGVRDFPEDAFRFAILDGRYPALVWEAAGGEHRKNQPAYWLRRTVTQQQNRELLPADAGFSAAATGAAATYIRHLIDTTA